MHTSSVFAFLVVLGSPLSALPMADLDKTLRIKATHSDRQDGAASDVNLERSMIDDALKQNPRIERVNHGGQLPEDNGDDAGARSPVTYFGKSQGAKKLEVAQASPIDLARAEGIDEDFEGNWPEDNDADGRTTIKYTGQPKSWEQIREQLARHGLYNEFLEGGDVDEDFEGGWEEDDASIKQQANQKAKYDNLVHFWGTQENMANHNAAR